MDYGIRILVNGKPVGEGNALVMLPGSKYNLTDKDGVAWFYIESDEVVLTSIRIETETGQAGMNGIELWPGITDVEV